MLQHRCPWCGKKISFWKAIKHTCKLRILRYYSDADKDSRCPYCAQKIQARILWVSIAVMILFLIALYPLGRALRQTLYHPGGSATYWAVFSIMLIMEILMWLLLLRMPYHRSYEKGSPAIRKTKIRVSIRWQSHRDKGLLFPKYQVCEEEIFPAYFLENGNVISNGLCVSLHDICWNNNRECTCSIELVLDSVPENTIQTADHFKLFYNRQAIAIGEI